MFSQLQNRCIFLLYLNEFHINVYFYLVPELNIPVEIVNVDENLWAVKIKFRFCLLADKMPIAAGMRSVFSDCQWNHWQPKASYGTNGKITNELAREIMVLTT